MNPQLYGFYQKIRAQMSQIDLHVPVSKITHELLKYL